MRVMVAVTIPITQSTSFIFVTWVVLSRRGHQPRRVRRLDDPGIALEAETLRGRVKPHYPPAVTSPCFALGTRAASACPRTSHRVRTDGSVVFSATPPPHHLLTCSVTLPTGRSRPTSVDCHSLPTIVGPPLHDPRQLDPRLFRRVVLTSGITSLRFSEYTPATGLRGLLPRSEPLPAHPDRTHATSVVVASGRAHPRRLLTKPRVARLPDLSQLRFTPPITPVENRG